MGPDPVRIAPMDEERKALQAFYAEGSGYWPPLPDEEVYAPGVLDDEDDDEDD